MLEVIEAGESEVCSAVVLLVAEVVCGIGVGVDIGVVGVREMKML